MRTVLWSLTLLLLSTTSALAVSKEIGPTDNVEAEIAALNPGDELVLRGGLYTLPDERFSIDEIGTEALPITVRSKDGETAHLHRALANQNIIDFIRADWLVLKNLEFSGGSAGLRFQRGNHVTIEGCNIHDTGDVAIRANDTGTTYEGFRILRNEVHHTNDTGEGMYLGCNSGGCHFNNALIEGNHVHHTDGPTVTQGDGIELKEGSGGNIVRDNVIHDTNYPCILVYSTLDAGVNILERNLLYNCGDHGIQAARDVIIRNNIILSANQSGIAMQPHQSGSPDNSSIVHNTIIKSSGAAVRVSTPIGPVLIANNAIYAQSGAAISVSGTASWVTAVGNVGRGSAPAGGLTAGVLADDFVQASYAGAPPMNPFPKAAGALVAGGMAAHVVADDFNGASRNGVADVGAYAFMDNNPGWTLAGDFKVLATVPLDGGTGGGAGGGGGGDDAGATGGGTGGGGGAGGGGEPDGGSIGGGAGGGGEVCEGGVCQANGCGCTSAPGLMALLGLMRLVGGRRRRPSRS